MPLLSVIRRGREQAKGQKEREEAKSKADTPKVPYKHIPTHAAIDAMSGAPNTIKELDRAKILEQHRRRSAMSINGISTGNNHRLGSSLSVVSYPSPQAIPIISRAGSSNSMPIHPRVRASIGATYGSYSSHSKGKERGVGSSLSTGAAIPMLASDQRGVFAVKGRSHTDTGENSSISGDDLEMKKITRPSIARSSHSADTRSTMPTQSSAKSKNLYNLYPSHQQKGRRQPSSGRSGRTLPQTTRTRFTEPKPMDIHVFNDGLGRDLSTATLDSVQNGDSYASSSTSRTVPFSTAPTSLASTPDPSTVAVAYFPSEVEMPHERPAPEPTSELLATETSSETSMDAPADVLDQPVRGPETLLQVTPWLEQTGVRAPAALQVSDNVEQTHTYPHDATRTAPTKPSKKNRWTWRRSKLATGDKLVTSH